MMIDVQRHKTGDWVAAALVGLPPVLELALILHHPVPVPTAGSAGMADPFSGIAAVIDANRSFHAVLIMLMILQMTGLFLLAQRLSFQRALVVAGGFFSGLAAILLLLATTHDGFVTFELIAPCRGAVEGCGEPVRAALAMVRASVQAFTKLGLVAQSFGFAAFAGALWSSGGYLRVVAMAGLAIALSPLGLLASDAYVGAGLIMQILIAHALFGVGAALLLGTGRLDRLLVRAGDRRTTAPANATSA